MHRNGDDFHIRITAPELPDLTRFRRIGCLVGILALAGVVLLGLVPPYTDWLWYRHDARQPQVFARAYSAKGALLLSAFLLCWALLYFNVRQAFRMSLVYLRQPESAGQLLLSNAMGWVQENGLRVVKWGSPVLAFLIALGFSNEWGTWLLASNAQDFGVQDPIFGRDLGFFVFTLPWYRALANFAMTALFLTAAITVGVYAGLQSLAMLARIELGRPFVRLHISLLVGALGVALAVQTWLKAFEIGLADSGQFRGAGFAMAQTLVLQQILAGLLLLIAVGTMVNGRLGRAFAVPLAGATVAGAFYILGLVLYPAIVQKLMVEPDRLRKEGPYAERAIRMTRYAYGLDRIEVKDQAVREAPTPREVAEAEATLDNMRLWDPRILREGLGSLQGFRPYYSFNDVDIDRYKIGGQSRMVMLAPRDIDVQGLSPEARSWVNTHLQYTHGYGLILSLVNTSTPNGQPTFLIKDLPADAHPDLPVRRPQVYFSDFRNEWGAETSTYALVNSALEEIDYPTETSTELHRWKGDRGVPLGGLLARAAWSARLADWNLLISGNVRGDTRLLAHRSVLDRARLIFPFLQFDRDPYMVLLGGRLVWVLDGYTTADTIPYADQVGERGGARLNYIRNSVKATIDAYTGEALAYAIEPGEPILRAYRRIYPGLVRDLSEAPAGLAEHFRYPEDLLQIQALQFRQYHVTDPVRFLNNADAWAIPSQRGATGTPAMIRPYYVQMKLPGAERDEFLQILPFTPNGKPNMSGWLAARCDPGQYGKLLLYRFTAGRQIPGPEQMEAMFNQDPVISSEVNRQLQNEQSEVLVGNLLVIPIGSSVMYAEPLFLRSKTQGIGAIPELKRVILALPNNRIVLGSSYREALQKLFGERPADTVEPAPSVEPPVPAASSPAGERERLRGALRLLNEADAALRAGDFAKYGELQRRLRSALEELAR